MLASGETIETCSCTMDLRRIIPTDVTASVVAHLSLLALLLLFSDVHPFGAVTAEQVAVEIVTPQEVPPAPVPEKKPEPVPTPTPTPQPDFTLLDKPAAPSPPQPAAKKFPAVNYSTFTLPALIR